jgi:hypothetical protein
LKFTKREPPGGGIGLTAKNISEFSQHRLRPIILVPNNFGYLSERLLGKDPTIAAPLYRWLQKQQQIMLECPIAGRSDMSPDTSQLFSAAPHCRPDGGKIVCEAAGNRTRR